MQPKSRRPLWSASVMCADLGRLQEEFQALEAAGCYELHFDIMDGHFVPNLTFGPDFVRLAKRCCGLPCDVHLMITNAGRYIARFIDAGADSISVHIETCTHVHRTLRAIREGGASPGVAICPATPLTKLEYSLPFIDRVMMMTVDPGYAGQVIIPSAFERVKIVRENLNYHEIDACIQVDGNINATNAARLFAYGANVFVLGSSSIFDGRDVGQALAEFSAAVERELATV